MPLGYCLYTICCSYFFFLNLRKPHFPEAHFVGPGEQVKLQLLQALTRDIRPNSNSRPTVQVSSFLSSHHVSRLLWTCCSYIIHEQTQSMSTSGKKKKKKTRKGNACRLYVTGEMKRL